MNCLLDTDVLSQLTKDPPHPKVWAWLGRSQDNELYMSAVSVQELRQGIEMMDAGMRKRRLDAWLTDELLVKYRDNILPVTLEIADLCGRIAGGQERRGHHPDLSDVYLAATAQVHGLRMATLNRRHFERLGVKLVDF